MKVVIAGGGTGGHIYPALAVASELRKRGAGLLWIGTESGLESRLVPQESIAFRTVRAAALPRRFSLAGIRGLMALCSGLYNARGLLLRERPDIVIGAGGFVSVPAVAAAYIVGIPVLLLEQNVLPGLTNRWMARRADAIAVSYEESLRYLGRARAVVTGNPVRLEILRIRDLNQEERSMAAGSLGLDPARTTVLAFGGSRGAVSINRAVLQAAAVLADRKDLQILHLTGSSHYEEIKGSMPPVGKLIYRVMPYLDEMSQALAVADLAICRAGATTIAELACCGLPAIMVPYPYAAENHQEYNARLLESAGGAEVISDGELDGDGLAGRISTLTTDIPGLKRMGDSIRTFARDDAAVKIADLAVKIAGHKCPH